LPHENFNDTSTSSSPWIFPGVIDLCYKPYYKPAWIVQAGFLFLKRTVRLKN